MLIVSVRHEHQFVGRRVGKDKDRMMNSLEELVAPIIASKQLPSLLAGQLEVASNSDTGGRGNLDGRKILWRRVQTFLRGDNMDGY